MERAEHRKWIGGRVFTLLSHYWRENDPVELTAAIGADWADVLEGLPHDIIQLACIQYERAEPRRKPTPGTIYQIAIQLMPKPKVVKDAVRGGTMCSDQTAYKSKPVNEDRANEAMQIAKDLGFALTDHRRNAGGQDV